AGVALDGGVHLAQAKLPSGEVAQPVSRCLGTVSPVQQDPAIQDEPGGGAGADGGLGWEAAEDVGEERYVALQFAGRQWVWEKYRKLGGAGFGVPFERAAPGDRVWEQEPQRGVSQSAAAMVHQAV